MFISTLECRNISRKVSCWQKLENCGLLFALYTIFLFKETGFLQTRGHRFHLCKVIFAADEIGLAPMLTNLQEQFRSRSLSVGSYPLDDDSDAQSVEISSSIAC